jgi:hypothetical protein
LAALLELELAVEFASKMYLMLSQSAMEAQQVHRKKLPQRRPLLTRFDEVGLKS